MYKTVLEDIIETVVLFWKQKQKEPPQLIIQTGFPFMEWKCWCAAGEIFHWLMAPLSVLSSLFFLTPFFSLSEKEFLSYSEHFWHCGHCKCVISWGFSPMVTNVWRGTLATWNVKCQVSECFWGAFRAYTRNYLQQWGQCFTDITADKPLLYAEISLKRLLLLRKFYFYHSELGIPGLNNLDVFPCNYSWLMLNVIVLC